jgi:hypothetical protein
MLRETGRDTLGLATRIRAIAVADPVLDLERRKNMLERDWGDYQFEELALTAIDTVTLRMDFEDGALQEDVIAAVARIAALQVPRLDKREHEAAAAWILNGLINVGSVDRGFEHVYGTVVDGEYRQKVFQFKLIKEVPGPDGRPRLRASNEAIAVLVGAVDVDIASEQVAADAKLDALVRRGRLADAYQAAEMALRRTVQYSEFIRDRLEVMRRDIRVVQWTRDLAGIQQEALEHIEERIRAENAIKTNLLRIVENTGEDAGAAQATALIEILEECLRRHALLQARLQEVGAVFRAEQDRQVFVPPPSRSFVDVFGQLLSPVLELSVADAGPLLEGFVRRSAGLARPRAIYLPDLVIDLLRPPLDRDGEDDLVIEPDLEEPMETPRFGPDQYAAVERILAQVAADGSRLGLLLGETRAPGEGTGPQRDTDRLLALKVLELFGVSRTGDDLDPAPPVSAWADGAVLEDARLAGDDLLVIPAGAQAEEI